MCRTCPVSSLEGTHLGGSSGGVQSTAVSLGPWPVSERRCALAGEGEAGTGTGATHMGRATLGQSPCWEERDTGTPGVAQTHPHLPRPRRAQLRHPEPRQAESQVSDYTILFSSYSCHSRIFWILWPDLWYFLNYYCILRFLPAYI